MPPSSVLLPHVVGGTPRLNNYSNNIVFVRDELYNSCPHVLYEQYSAECSLLTSNTRPCACGLVRSLGSSSP